MAYFGCNRVSSYECPLQTFAGLDVFDYDVDLRFEDPEHQAYRIQVDLDELGGGDYDDTVPAYFDQVLTDAEQVQALVLACDGEDAGDAVDLLVPALVAHADRLPALRAVFLGDVEAHPDPDWGVSVWLKQRQLTPLLDAFPSLQRLGVRANTIQLEGPDTLERAKLRKYIKIPPVAEAFSHDKLRALILEATESITNTQWIDTFQLPELEELELWFGGGMSETDFELEHLTGLLSGKLFPKLRRLGLRNSKLQDGIAGALASSPLLGRLEHVDLSFGTLGDEGAEALLASPALAGLKLLDITHHYVSKPVLARLKKAVGGKLVSKDAHDSAGERYVAVAE